MTYHIKILLLSLAILWSCVKNHTIDTPENSQKTPYHISTFVIGESKNKARIEKTGRIVASSTLTISAQAWWEIKKLYTKEWKRLQAGSLIATLKDTQYNYDLRYQQAQAALKTQDASINISRINLDQAVTNAEISLKRAKQALNTLNQKNAISYDTIVNKNQKTLIAYGENYKTYLVDTDRLMTQLLYEADKIMGITDAFKYQANAWRPFLGMKMWDAYSLAEKEWNATFTLRDTIRKKVDAGATINIENAWSDFELISQAYEQSRKLADSMNTMLQNNTITTPITPDMNARWNSTWTWLRWSVQGAESQFNGWKSQTITFFEGYKNSELAQKFAVKRLTRSLSPEERSQINNNTDLKVSYNDALIGHRDRLESAKLAVSQAKKAYESAQSLRTATINQMLASRQSASISLKQASRDYAKLRIVSPVNWTIAKMLVNIWQQVSAWTPIAEFVSNTPEIVIDLDTNTVSMLSVGDSLKVHVNDVQLDANVIAISNVVNKNLLSTVRIAVPHAQDFIGQSATIIIDNKNVNMVHSGSLILPLDALSIVWENEAEIHIYESSTGVIKKTVKTWKLYGDTIEIIDTLPKNTEIIINSLVGYDPEKNKLIKSE